ncbi:hypothetical protein HJC99_00790 [Candidatus Saccharibacteria bacterium]|nr:hypothetical protein [Candidatus Saccharibacteria bacterium]
MTVHQPSSSPELKPAIGHSTLQEFVGPNVAFPEVRQATDADLFKLVLHWILNDPKHILLNEIIRTQGSVALAESTGIGVTAHELVAELCDLLASLPPEAFELADYVGNLPAASVGRLRYIELAAIIDKYASAHPACAYHRNVMDHIQTLDHAAVLDDVTDQIEIRRQQLMTVAVARVRELAARIIARKSEIVQAA